MGILLLSLLAARCSPAAAPAAAQPTAASAAALPAKTATVPTPTSTTAPSATPSPTSTAIPTLTPTATPTATPSPTSTPTPTPLHPLSIAALRQAEYPGSDVAIEQTLEPGANYSRYIASYRSEGLKIYALLTVPTGQRPASGWPVIVFNHGYIPPAQYRPTERYVAYVDAFARNGYIVFRPDYRGHGRSEGVAVGSYGSPAYTIDVLNAVASVKRHPDADAQRIGMWGHSMGGHITLRSMVVDHDIRAGVIWAGVVASYPDLMSRWTRRVPWMPPPTPTGAPGAVVSRSRRWRDELLATYGSPEQNPAFWASISANSFLADLSGPLQLHHGTDDESVPVAFSETLYEQLQAAGQTAELFTYEGDNHNISVNFSRAMQRSVAFFDAYVKGG
ncbi:MAG: alpha/beta fold hydrolase [Chloroflexi bacterium]|nr:alpha/beta fold hydrolase [Chloroflexota bacterium]